MTRCLQPLPLALIVTVAGIPCAVAMQARPEPPASRDFEARVRPLVSAYCVSCHNATRHEGNLDFSRLSTGAAAVRQRALWGRVAPRVRSREMPPPGAKQPQPAEREALLRWAERAAEYFDPNDPAGRDPGPTVLRRLTRAEYDLTVRNLLGIDFDSGREVGLPGAETTGTFDNVAAALSFSPALLDKYFAASEKITDRVMKDGRARNALFTPRPSKDLPDRDAAHQIVARLLRAAYRRPVQPAEVERMLKLYDAKTSAGATWEEGVAAVLKPVLVSPYFLFRVEADRPATSQPYRVSDPELSVRLSYFLWSTQPDETLAALAEQGKLSDPAVLEEQVRRMLADPKAAALSTSFGAQWLQLAKLDTARPSTEFFPTFNNNMRRAMREETLAFFDHLRQEDRSVLELLDSDYTYVNADLAKQYGLPPVEGAQMRRVSLPPEAHRGGLLGMGSVLALTSHTSRTSPTLRGKYVLDVLFGTPPPPPPANVSMIKEEKGKEAVSFREKLAQHAADPSCSGCHRKMDPLGFALDNYNAVGVWRDSRPDQPLDTSGELPSGEKLNGVAELKQVLLRRKGEFARNLAAQALSYALGRELRDTDDFALHQIQVGLERDGYRFSSLVLGVARSVPFQYRKNSESAAAK